LLLTEPSLFPELQEFFCLAGHTTMVAQ
jgi:hypothetical protein